MAIKLPKPISVGKNAPIKGNGPTPYFNQSPKTPFGNLKRAENHVVNGVKSAVNTVGHGIKNAFDELGL